MSTPSTHGPGPARRPTSFTFSWPSGDTTSPATRPSRRVVQQREHPADRRQPAWRPARRGHGLRASRHVLPEAANRHYLRAGFGVQHVRERSRIEFYLSGLFIYVTDTRELPLAYAFGRVQPTSDATTTRFSGYAQDDWAFEPNLRLNLAFATISIRRATIPTSAIRSSRTAARSTRTTCSRGRPSRGMSAHRTAGRRGGAGLFTGRYLLTPLLQELQQNGVTGRIVQTRLNGALFGFPALALTRAARSRPASRKSRTYRSWRRRSMRRAQHSRPSGGRCASGRVIFCDVEGVFIDGPRRDHHPRHEL